MQATTYYRLSLAVPLILPLIVWPLLFSLQYGGVPYLLFVGGLLYWMRGKSEEQVERAASFAPLLMAIIYLVVYAIDRLTAHMAIRTWGDYEFFAGVGIPCILLLGYGYVWFVRWVLYWLKVWRVVIGNLP